MNKILSIHRNRKKKIKFFIIFIFLLIFIMIYIFYKNKGSTNVIQFQNLSLEDIELEEKIRQRSTNANKQETQGDIILNKSNINVKISSDNTVNLQDFGAIGDSFYYNAEDNQYYSDKNFINKEHTNSKALQECLNYAEENKCNVRVPKGVYCIDEYILIPDNIEIIGEEGAVFLIYDKFKSNDDFVFRNKLLDSKGTIKIRNICFRMEAYKNSQFENQEGLFLKFHNLNELDIQNCKVEIENKGKSDKCTAIDARGNFDKITISNCEIINQSQSTKGGNIWIRNDYSDGKIGEINIINNIIKKNGNDEAIAIWGEAKVGKVNIKENQLEYTNISEIKNDIFISCYATKNTWSIEEYNFENNDIKVFGKMNGVLSITDKDGSISNINILRNRFEFQAMNENAYGGIIRITNYNLENIGKQNVNIYENYINTMNSHECRQIVNLQNVNANINNNIINGKVTYGLIFIDNNCYKAKIELNNNEINVNLINTATILTMKDTDVEFIATNNNINNVSDNYRGIIYISPEDANYENQKKAKQKIKLKDNTFKNMYRVLQYEEKNDIETFEIEGNEFEDITEVIYENNIKRVFNGDVIIKDNYFYNKDKDRVMNIEKTDLSQAKEIQIEKNYYINKNIDDVANSIINKYDEFEANCSQSIKEKIAKNVSDLKEYIVKIKNTKNIEKKEIERKLKNHYDIGKQVIEINKVEKNYIQIEKAIEMLNELEEIAKIYDNLIIIIPRLEEEEIIENNFTEIEEILNSNEDINMKFVIDKLEICKSYYKEIENMNNYQKSNGKKGLIISRNIHIKELFEWEKEFANLYIDKYIADNPVTITYSETNLTNQDIIATLKTNANIEITNNANNNQHTFTENGNFVFQYTIKGRAFTTEAKVNNIDKIPPNIEGIEAGKVYIEKVKPKISDINLEKVELLLNEQLVEDYTINSEITGEGLYYMTAIDKAGNITMINFQILENKDDNYKMEKDTIKNISSNTKKTDFSEKLNLKLEYEIYRNDEKLENDSIIATGDVLKTISGDNYTLIVAGDINKDGEVNIRDIVKMRKYLLERNNLDEVEMLAADTNLDGNEINIKDLVRMRIIALTKNEI